MATSCGRRLGRLGGVLLVLGGAQLAALGQGASDDPRRAREVPRAGFWPTPRMIDLGIDRMTEEMAEHYGFDEDQLYQTRLAIKDRVPRWMEENRAEVQTLMNRYFEALLEENPPTPDEVAEWAQRALPLVNDFVDVVGETADEMRTFMTDDQSLMLDGEMAAFRVGVKHLRQRLDTWAAGGYDPETEWHRRPGFDEEQAERERRLQEEADEARLAAMGLREVAAGVDAETPTAVGDSTADGAPRSGTDAATDLWEEYVKAFIRRYELNEAQQNAAYRTLRSLTELRDQYLKRRLPAIKKLQERLAAAETDAEREAVRDDYEKLTAPLDRYFEQLRERLDRIPTRAQRAAAARLEGASEAQTE
jgi:hypothetical protein